MKRSTLGKLTDIKTGKLDVNAGSEDGFYPFFTCAAKPYKINEYAFDNEAVLIAGNGDLNVKYYSGKFNAYQRTYVIQNIDSEILSMKYLYYFMETYMGRLRRDAIGGIIKYIKLGHLTEAEIPLPPIDDQKRIAHLLGKVEGLIARRKQHLQQLDDLLKSVFLEMFGDPVRNEKAWDTLPFHKVGQFVSGGTPSKSRDEFWKGNFPWVSPKDMKVVKIDDATDHISEVVFEETTLKRIAPGHLLIVVRGMILAHSFPVAVNTVEIAINQDMKAIKPVKGINVVYLQNCLAAQKRQILKLISTAGHGTRKFDTIAMQKLFIPKPPTDLQNQFAAIVEKLESLKTRYQQSLTDLENLYGALSQQAFKGELDLSRVPLPLDNDEAPQQAVPTPEQQSAPETFQLPEPPASGEWLSAKNRQALIEFWLNAWFQHYVGEPFSATAFIDVAYQRLVELSERDAMRWDDPAKGWDESKWHDEPGQFGTAEYEHIKQWVFDALAGGKLKQSLDGNQIQIAFPKRPANWGTW